MDVFTAFLIAMFIVIIVLCGGFYLVSVGEKRDEIEEEIKINFDKEYIHNVAVLSKKKNSVKDLEEIFEKIYNAATKGEFSIYLDYGSLDAAEIKFLRKKGFKVKTVHPVIDYGYVSGGYLEVKW